MLDDSDCVICDPHPVCRLDCPSNSTCVLSAGDCYTCPEYFCYTPPVTATAELEEHYKKVIFAFLAGGVFLVLALTIAICILAFFLFRPGIKSVKSESTKTKTRIEDINEKGLKSNGPFVQLGEYPASFVTWQDPSQAYKVETSQSKRNSRGFFGIPSFTFGPIDDFVPGDPEHDDGRDFKRKSVLFWE